MENRMKRNLVSVALAVAACGITALGGHKLNSGLDKLDNSSRMPIVDLYNEKESDFKLADSTYSTNYVPITEAHSPDLRESFEKAFGDLRGINERNNTLWKAREQAKESLESTANSPAYKSYLSMNSEGGTDSILGMALIGAGLLAGYISAFRNK